MTIRNNQERLGIKDGGENPPIPQATSSPQSQPALQFVTPTEFVDLPSKGKFYPASHPLCNAEVVEIRYMTAKDEDILSSQTLLKKGIAIDRFLQNILVDKSIDINSLLVGDKNAITVAARVTGYGSHYPAQVACPACSKVSEKKYDLNEAITSNIDEEELENKYNVRKTENNTFIFPLERSKVDVEVKLLTSKDEAVLLKFLEKKRKNKLPETPLTDQLRAMIVSINGNSTEEYVNSFINNMPAMDSKYLRTAYQKIVPNIDLSQLFSCPDCGYEGEVDMPFGATFFWPR